ncbi:hypothetical protein D3C87_1599420 [compost metagenome]
MEHGSIAMIAVLVICGFLAGVIDSVVGGGGLIAIPALLSVGIPLPLLLGSNKLAGTLCSFTSTVSFVRSGKIDCGLAEVPGTAFTKGGKEYIIMEKHFGSAGDRSRKEP